MNDEAAFLKALHKNPNDDTTRLVYADWLDDHNDPRAEFIRLRQQFAELTARINELAGQCDPAWLAAVGGPQLKPHEIIMRSGRWLWLRELRQRRTYGSRPEALPTREDNRRRLDEIVGREREWFRREPYVIQPKERAFRTDDEVAASPESRAALPGIVCVARFKSISPARNPQSKQSQLVVIWFQDEYAFPIDPAVREQIRAIDWETHAADFDW